MTLYIWNFGCVFFSQSTFPLKQSKSTYFIQGLAFAFLNYITRKHYSNTTAKYIVYSFLFGQSFSRECYLST